MSRLDIGLEGHDGTGKSATAIEVAKLLGGDVFFSDDETKKMRQGVYKDKSLSTKTTNECCRRHLSLRK